MTSFSSVHAMKVAVVGIIHGKIIILSMEYPVGIVLINPSEKMLFHRDNEIAIVIKTSPTWTPNKIASRCVTLSEGKEILNSYYAVPKPIDNIHANLIYYWCTYFEEQEESI